MPRYYLLSTLVAFCCLSASHTVNAAVPVFDVTPTALLRAAPTAAQFPDSGVIVLRDESVVHLNTDGSNTEVTHRTIKIFNQRGRSRA